MSLLIPGTTHQITWSVQDITDSTTYYVRAVIRDLRAGTILDTLNLVDQGNNRFSKSWNVPQDGQGFGRIIEIEKTVYTNSSYTTASPIYGRYLEQYTIFNLANRLPSTGGYGGSGIDYREISNSIKKALEPTITLLKSSKNQDANKPIDISGISKNIDLLLNEMLTLSQKVNLIEKKGDQVKPQDNSKFDSIKSDIVTELRTYISYEIDNLKTNLESKISKIESSMREEESQENLTITSIKDDITYQISDLSNKIEDKLQTISDELKNNIDEATSQPLNISFQRDKNPKKDIKKEQRNGQINNLLNE